MQENSYVPKDITTQIEVVNTNQQLVSAAAWVENKYTEARTGRDVHEQRWLKFFNQFRGNYNPEELAQLSQLLAKNPYSSQAFIRITKVKCLAAVGSLYEALFAGNKVPIGVEETPEPEGIAKKVHIDLANQKDSVAVTDEADDIASAIGYPGDGKEIERGASFKDMFAGLDSKYKRLFKNGTLLREGDSPDPINAIEIHPAKEAALRMNSVLQDQLTEAETIKKIELMLWEMVVFGTGVLKGPHTTRETIPNWTYDEELDIQLYEPITKLRPHLKQVSLWNIFPDPYAETVDDLTYVIEKHKMSRSKLDKLRNQPGFNAEAIKIALRQAGGIQQEEWELTLKDYSTSIAFDDRYEVLEFWGDIEYEEAKRIGIKGLPPKSELSSDIISVNIWTVNGMAIKAVINPFIPERIPYYFARYEIQPYQLWGVGIPENMEDAQGMINAHTRAAQDNLRLAGSCVLEINETFLAPGWDPTIYPGKTFIKKGGPPGQAVHSINFNNVAPAHFQMIQEANRYADQTTLPSVLHGQTGVSGTGRTAFGLSALMSSGNLSIRTVVKNLDRELLKPLGQALFHWNMQFNTDIQEIRGDLKIIAKGTAALAMKEVQSQRLLSLLQIAANPLVAPFVNVPTILKDLAISLDLDPNDVINEPDQAKLFAQIIGEQANVNFQASPESQQGAAQAGPQRGRNLSQPPQTDASEGLGGGNIGDRVGQNTGETPIT
jgi:hypothetical protein